MSVQEQQQCLPEHPTLQNLLSTCTMLLPPLTNVTVGEFQWTDESDIVQQHDSDDVFSSNNNNGTSQRPAWPPIHRLPSLVIAALATFCFVRAMWSALCPPGFMPQLRCKDSALSRYLRARVSRLSKPYRPPIWAQSPHAQTVMGTILPTARHLRFDREYLQLNDRGVVALDWAKDDTIGTTMGPSSTILLLIPGFAADSVSVTRGAAVALLEGFRPVVFLGQGTAGTPLFSPKLQSYGDTSSFQQVVRYLHVRWPSAQLTALSFGTGSGPLFSYLGEYGSSAHVASAAVVSPVWDAPELFKNFPNPYGWVELLLAKRLLLQHARALEKVVDVGAALKSSTLNEFIQRIFCPMYGYADLDEFWDKNHPLRDVDDIAVPLVAIQSLDDPVCPASSVPLDIFSLYPNFVLVTVERGGHCGFLEGDRAESWASKMALDCLRAMLDFAKSESLANLRRPTKIRGE